MWKKSEPEKLNPQPAPSPAVFAQPAPALRNPVPQTKECAVIGPTILIKGDLTGEEDLLIEGRVEGKIELRRHSITIGKNGRIKADIYGRIIVIEGTVEGNLYGEEQLIVRQSGTVHGNILAPRVALEDGSNFKGSIDMSPREKAATPVTHERPTIGTKAP
jgi:cytoskeletal protein CcmA (bactofilin family)